MRGAFDELIKEVSVGVRADAADARLRGGLLVSREREARVHRQDPQRLGQRVDIGRPRCRRVGCLHHFVGHVVARPYNLPRKCECLRVRPPDKTEVADDPATFITVQVVRLDVPVNETVLVEEVGESGRDSGTRLNDVAEVRASEDFVKPFC